MKNKIQAFRHNMRSEKHCFSNSTHRNLNALEWISLLNIVKINISASIAGLDRLILEGD